MKRLLTVAIILGALCGTLFLWTQNANKYGAPPYIDTPTTVRPELFDRGSDFADWKRPEGPLKVGIQAGHWKTSEMPEEQRRLRERGGGTSGQGVQEWEVNLSIAQLIKPILEKEGIVVDILPSTIPPGYWADVFVSIHADGNPNPLTSGYKVAAPRRDYTGRGGALVSILEEEYEKATGFPRDPNITRNMTGYYAFAWWRFDHAIHPMTPAAIVETGFMTNPQEATVLINSPEVPAQAIAAAILRFLDA